MAVTAVNLKCAGAMGYDLDLLQGGREGGLTRGDGVGVGGYTGQMYNTCNVWGVSPTAQTSFPHPPFRTMLLNHHDPPPLSSPHFLLTAHALPKQ